MKIVLFVNSEKTFFWHRRSLADLLIRQGHEVNIICSNKDGGEIFAKSSYKVFFLNMSRKGINPFQEFKTLSELYQLITKIRPDLCHNFTIKCVIYGSLVQRFLRVKHIVNSITGLGIVFTKRGILQVIVKLLYSFVLKYSRAKMIFQNEDDYNFFKNSNLLKNNKATLIPGSGVNTELFFPAEKIAPVKVIFASRFLRSKGMLETLRVSVKLYANGIKHELLVAGDFDPASADSLTEADLRDFRIYEHIKFLGNVHEIEKVINRCHVACFPSKYREGVPKFLIESAASGLAIVTSDRPGCRAVVTSNGFLVDPNDENDLYKHLKKLLHSPETIATFGTVSRQLALSKFDERIILQDIVNFYGTKGHF